MMKKIIQNEYFLAIAFLIIIICATLLHSIQQDYTSIIDFDLTVIHNSLQLVSNKYPIIEIIQLIHTNHPI